MASTFKWSAVFSLYGTNLITTEANSLADNAYTALGAEYDNTSGLNVWGRFIVNLASLNPTGTAFVTIYIVKADAAGNYEDGPSSTLAGYDHEPIVLFVPTGSATKRRVSYPVKLPPCKFKLVVRNDTNVALAASGNTVGLEVANRGAV